MFRCLWPNCLAGTLTEVHPCPAAGWTENPKPLSLNKRPDAEKTQGDSAERPSPGSRGHPDQATIREDLSAAPAKAASPRQQQGNLCGSGPTTCGELPPAPAHKGSWQLAVEGAWVSHAGGGKGRLETESQHHVVPPPMRPRAQPGHQPLPTCRQGMTLGDLSE